MKISIWVRFAEMDFCKLMILPGIKLRAERPELEGGRLDEHSHKSDIVFRLFS
jgi:hypothetical protein